MLEYLVVLGYKFIRPILHFACSFCLFNRNFKLVNIRTMSFGQFGNQPWQSMLLEDKSALQARQKVGMSGLGLHLYKVKLIKNVFVVIRFW